MNAQRARQTIDLAQHVLERVTGKNKADATAIARVRELLASANRDLPIDEAAPVALPANDGTSAAQARRKERFW